MKFILTNAGKEMESKLAAGSKPIITRIESGDTYSPNPESLQSVINKKQLLQVESIEVVNGKSCITFLLTNLELAAEYWIRQIGIYAKQDEASAEVLYLIGQDATGELVPAPEDRVVEYIYKLNLAVDNAYDMSFVVNSTDFARKQQVLNLEQSKVSASGGDISNTVTAVEEPESASDEYPEISGKGSVKEVMGKLLRWVKSLKDDKVTASGGDIADTKVVSLQASSVQYPIPAAGDTTQVMFGKTKKFFEDVKNWMTGVCLIGQIVNNCVTNNPNMPLSAAQGKVLMDLYTQLNSKLVGSTIKTIHLETNESVAIPKNITFLLVAGRAQNGIPIGVYAGSTNDSLIFNFTAIKNAEGSTLSVNGLSIAVSTLSGTFAGFLIAVPT